MWSTLKNISDDIKSGKRSAEIFIITARNSIVKTYIYKFLKDNGIHINIDCIVTISDEEHFNISKEKQNILSRIADRYDEVFFYDDDPNNIKLASQVSGVKCQLVEHLNEKFTDESDPIKDLGIGIYCHKDFKNIEDMHEWLYTIGPNLLKIDKMVDIISKDSDHVLIPEYFHKLKAYLKEYLTINGKIPDYLEVDDFRDLIYRKNDMKKRKSVNEKFTEDSDPIADMNIGLRHQITQWLKKMDIENYTINKDFTINVNGDVRLHAKLGEETQLPKYIKFNIIYGKFLIYRNKLTTLKGCPVKVVGSNDTWGSFRCYNNNLTSLKYAPKYVEGDFDCRNNPGNFTREDVKKVCKVGRDIEI
jgi:hypothetical protein